MWIALTLLTAVCTALRDVASKQATRTVDPLVVATGMAAVPAVSLGAVVAAVAVVTGGWSPPRPDYWLALLVSGGINAVATPLIVVALKRSDLSLVAPLTSLTPLFMLVTGAVVLGEVPGPRGMAGVAVIVAGAYLLTMSERAAGPLEPFRALLRDPGARAMLLVAFLYSISAAYDKVGTGASSPLLWAASVYAVTAVGAGSALLVRRGAWGRKRSGGRGDGGSGAGWAIVLAGLFTAIGAAAQMTALMLTLAAFVIAVKRTSTLFGVLLGASVFRESHVKERLLGAVVMLAGFALVTLG